jgi:hypothetical protein
MLELASNPNPRPPQPKVWHVTVRQAGGGDGKTRIHFVNSDPVPDAVIALIAPCEGVDARVSRMEQWVSKLNAFLIDIEIRRTL